MAYRSSTGNLDYCDDRQPRQPERWDRERFERYRSRGPDDRRSGSVRFEDNDSRGPRRERRNTEVDIDDGYGRGGMRVEIKEREYEKPRQPRRPEFLDRHEPTPSEIANQALAPYRRASPPTYYDPPARRPARPQYVRRQSSLDTYDRRPLPRYGDREDDGWRPPKNVPIPLPIREPPRQRPREDHFEEIHYRDGRPEYDEEYREVEIRRESSRRRRRGKRSKAPSVREPSPSSSSESSFEEITVNDEPPPPPKLGKKGRTRMPKRLCHKRAIIEKGLEFDEEASEDFYVVKRALEKEQIDEIIKVSEDYLIKETSKVTYRYEEKEEAPPPPPEDIPPPPPPPVSFAPASPPPPPQSVHSHHSHHTQHFPPAQVVTRAPSVAAPRSEYYEERVEHQGESGSIAGPLAVFAPDRRVRSDREIRDEIRILEEERRLVRVDNRGYEEREYIEVKPPRDVIRVEKDRKEYIIEPKRKKDNSKILAGMIATLT